MCCHPLNGVETIRVIVPLDELSVDAITTALKAYPKASRLFSVGRILWIE